MAYQRKTKDVWNIYINCCEGYEYACGSNVRAETVANLKDYRVNAPDQKAILRKEREPL